jgi:hypothetical protein
MKHKKTAALICALLMLCGCDNSYNGGDRDLKAQLDLLQSEIDRLSGENAELREENGKLLGAKESAEEELELLRSEKAEPEKTPAESEKPEESEKPAYSPVTLHKSEYTLQYLGNERGENGECIVVMRCQGFYTYPYIRIDTKDFDLHHGVFAVEGKYEFVNENIDEDGYLYLINSSGMADSYAEDFPDMKLSFVPEKYIKLRAAAPDTLMYDDADGPTSFIGYLNVKEIGIKEDGSIDENEYEKESTIDIMCYTDFMKFDESGYNYDKSGMGR